MIEINLGGLLGGWAMKGTDHLAGLYSRPQTAAHGSATSRSSKSGRKMFGKFSLSDSSISHYIFINWYSGLYFPVSLISQSWQASLPKFEQFH